MKEFDWNHPVTRKDYAVLCAWSLGIYTAIYTVAIVLTYWDNIKTWAKRKVKKIKSKLAWCN